MIYHMYCVSTSMNQFCIMIQCLNFPIVKSSLDILFCGFAENTGDKLTFSILKTDKKTVLYCSVVRSASEDLATGNKRVQFDWPIQDQLDKIDPPITSGDTPRDSDERDRHTDRPPPDRNMHTSTVASRTHSKSKTSPETHLSLYNANLNWCFRCSRNLMCVIPDYLDCMFQSTGWTQD
jgi:hypothetical protein